MTPLRPAIISLRELRKSFGAKEVLPGFNLSIAHNEFITLLGPSGCGKTTVLRLIAGFERPDSGTIVLDDRDITTLPPHQRPVNTVFQNYALFPHLNVFDNVAYGLRTEKTPRSAVASRVQGALAMVQLESQAQHKPQQLSGGQQQRVALARAIVKKPQVLLLDEPLSALDYKLRKQMQNELKRIQRELGITFIFVTHDQEEALSMSDRIVVMRDGRIEQIGTPRNIYENPANVFVARFIGESNILPGTVQSVADNQATVSIESQNFTLTIRDTPVAPGDDINVLLRPEDLRLLPGDAATGLPGKIVERNYKGMMLDSVVRLPSGQELIASEFFDESDPDFDHQLNEAVKVSWVSGWEKIIRDG